MKNYSDFWFDKYDTDIDELLGIEKEKPKKDYIQMASNQRAIANFVRIVSGQNIPVKYTQRGDSYTDGKNVTISANINDKNFDHVVGLALHEGSHIAFSDFELLADAIRETPEDWTYEQRAFFKNMINFIEDRRIDTKVFKSSPGYKGYYHSLYKKYFRNNAIRKGLKSGMYREYDIESYEFRILGFMAPKESDLDALPKLREIYNLMDLKNVLRLSPEGVIDLAREVSNMVFSIVGSVKSTNDENGNGQPESQNGDGENEESDSQMGGGTTIDIGDAEMTPGDDAESGDAEDGEKGDSVDFEELSDRQKKSLINAVQKAKDFMDGKTPKSKLTKRDAQIVNSVAKSGAEMVEVGDGGYMGKTKCVVIPNLTQDLIDSNAFHFAQKPWLYGGDDVWDSHYGKPILEGLRLGTMLGKKLKVRGEERDLIFTRQDTGKIDKRLISELGFGNERVFSQTFTERYNKANLHISIDGSGSMNGKKWENAITSTVAIIKAAEMAGNIRVVVSMRYTNENNPVLLIAYDSQKDKISKVKNLWPSLRTSGTTPESLCYEAMMNHFLGLSNSDDNYFINYSDGAPWFGNNDIHYSGTEAVKHTQKMVKQLRNNGIKILSYFISSDYSYENEKTTFSRMYGRDATFINPTNMMEVAKTMNNMFLEK
tara:strand:+ start:851 stop:2818 length:1968 start_codon:yes stop_codon:yes gene_type:complete